MTASAAFQRSFAVRIDTRVVSCRMQGKVWAVVVDETMSPLLRAAKRRDLLPRPLPSRPASTQDLLGVDYAL